MIVPDTNVPSALMRPSPDIEVLRWLDRQSAKSIWTTSITVFEIHFGLQTMPLGKRQAAMKTSFDHWLRRIIQERIAVYDHDATVCAANLAANRKARGRPGELRDTMIAGIVVASHAILATHNTKHFEDIAKSVVNPWE
jgi:toxin FitB